MQVPIKKVATRKINYNGQEYSHSWQMLDESKVLGFINHRLYTDVESYAVLELSKNGKRAIVIRVEIPLARCDNPAAARADGVPDGIAILGQPFDAKFTYGKWRGVDNKEIIGTTIGKKCLYYYDLSF